MSMIDLIEEMRCKMRNKIVLVYVSLMVLSVLVSSQQYPNLNNKFVNDFAGLMSSQQVSDLTSKLEFIEKNTTVEIAVLTIASTSGEDRTSFANHIGQQNGVGKKATDNGVVIIWSINNQRGGGIATGRGIESVLNDAKVVRIGKAARPLFDEGKVYEGFNQMIDGISGEISNSNEYTASNTQVMGDDNSSKSSGLGTILILIVAVVVIFFLSVSSRILMAVVGHSEEEDTLAEDSLAVRHLEEASASAAAHSEAEAVASKMKMRQLTQHNKSNFFDDAEVGELFLFMGLTFLMVQRIANDNDFKVSLKHGNVARITSKKESHSSSSSSSYIPSAFSAVNSMSHSSSGGFSGGGFGGFGGGSFGGGGGAF
jgi:uncharacterized protein